MNALDRTFWPTRNFRARLCLLVSALALASGSLAQAPSSGGLGTAADYIVGFVQYVRWPAEESLASWQVCVAAPLADKAAAYAGRTARGKPFAVRAIAAGDTLVDCHVVELMDASEADARRLLERARHLPVLTVGDGERFCSAGGIACLRLREGAGGFEINLSAVQQARLVVNAQLLMLGRKRHVAGSGS
jgi:hypothetical protein